MGWYLLDKYYQKTNETPINATILFFNSRKQAVNFKQNWPSSWYYPSLERANNIFDNNYRHAAPPNVN